MGYYLFAILPNINLMLAILLTVASFLMAFFIILFCITLEDDDDLHKTIEKIGKAFIPFYVVLILLQTFIPSQKQLAFIIAAPYIVENQQLQEAGKNSAELIKLGTEYVKDILTTATTKKGK